MSPHPFIDLAVKSVQYFLKHKNKLSCPENLPTEFKRQAGVFVSIKNQKELRGCIGTIEPVEDDLAREIIRNAVHAATEDPRFLPVTSDELPNLTFSIDVLTPLEKVNSVFELDCKKYGVLLKGKNRQGVLLPDLEAVNTVEDQITICRKKAGLKENDPVEMFRFRVERYH